MENNYVTLTDTDRQILKSYEVVLDGLSEYLGEGYELILHSLENLDKSVIKIINGHYTGRVEGAPITDLALYMLEKIKTNKQSKSLCYFNKNKNGATLKSTTIPIIGENHKIIGLICINLHTEISFYNMLSSFLPQPETASPTPVTEVFAENVEELINTNLDDARRIVWSNPNISSTNRNKEIITILYQKGTFNVKDAVIRVADLLGISKNTVYMHLRNIQKEETEQRCASHTLAL